jgi:glycosyltransferase involved in cell wall biosynthesis
MAMVDVIIPLYNKQATIQRAIRSVQSQTFTDWRLIVVDDGSTDQGPQIVDQMRRQDRRIELIGQSNAGPGAARNAGISAATASCLAFLDADDQWYPWHLQEAVPILQNNNVAMAGAAYHQWPGQTDVRDLWAGRGISPGTYQIKGDESAEWVEAFVVLFHVDTTVVRTDIARRYGGFFEQGCRHGEDIIFFAQIIFNESFAWRETGGPLQSSGQRTDFDICVFAESDAAGSHYPFEQLSCREAGSCAEYAGKAGAENRVS